MKDKLKILYVDMGGVAPYSCDKPVGRISGWAELQNDVCWLIPKLIEKTAKEEIRDISKSPERIKIVTFPFSGKKRFSSFGIILAYFSRILFSPIIFFKKLPGFDIGYSNSSVLVDIVPILWLKIFGKCRHWILMMDSIVPPPSERSGSAFVNVITYLESRFVTMIAKRFATVIFTVNPELKDVIVKRGVDEKKVFLTQNGLFMDKIDRVSATEKDNYDAVYMGRITENKGIFDLLSVWTKVIEKIPSAKLAIMGTGRSEVVKNFVGKIKEKGLEKNIDYLGFVGGDEKYIIFKSSKMFLFLSKVNADESWGISLMEGLACGLPAVTYNLAIYNHVYEDGLLLKNEIGDTASVTAKTLTLLNNPKERESFAIRGIEFAKQFNWATIAKEDLNKIKEIIKT